MQLFSVANKVIIISGGSGGIGRHFIRFFLDEDATVINLSSNQERLKYVQPFISNHENFESYICDITDERQVKKCFAKVIETYGKIDVLINMAAINVNCDINSLEVSQWDKVQQVNVTGTFLCIREAVKYMKDKKRGKIVNIASVAANLGHANQSAYAASKGAVLSLTRSLAVELAEYNIQINAIGPSAIVTETNEDYLMDEGNRYMFESRIPLARLGRPEDMLGAVCFLAAEASDFITGEIIMVDGGQSINF